jgi:hypothetical protein
MMDEIRINDAYGQGLRMIRLEVFDLHAPLRSEAEPIEPEYGVDVMADGGDGEYVTITLNMKGIHELGLAVARIERAVKAGRPLD